MNGIETEILVVGGGIAGLTATCGFASAGFSTLCVDPEPPVTEGNADGADLRSTAFLQPALATLDRAGLRDRLAPFAAPLRVMRIIDAGGRENIVRETADFVATDVGEAEFGWNLPNWCLRREMLARMGELPLASVRRAGFRRMVPRDGTVLVELTDGAWVQAGLVVAADGRDSAVRQALGIGARRVVTGQKALVFTVTCSLPHDAVSTEIHRTGGPFTLVPLPDRDGQPQAAVVWMEEGPEATRLAALPVPDLTAAINARSCGVLGPLTLASRVMLWPILSQLADRFDGPRTALMAEAAHVMPPIGAQGLNLSLKDLACLLDLTTAARAAGRDIGEAGLVARYHRLRWPEAAARVAGVGVLNWAARSEPQPLRDLRRAGLRALHGIAPLRQLAMRAGLGL